ncbi:MAG TPA: hypothetical protein VN436_13320, partial [Holophaga sp.]|nr:hypothetical protein [Holophaga sp.]
MVDNASEPLKQLIHQWVNDKHQSLLEKVMMTWQEGMENLSPDEPLLQKIHEMMAPAPAPLDPFPDVMSDTEQDLGSALDLIESSASQGEALKRLLEGLQPFTERSALFVIKQGIASLFAARGFGPDTPKQGAPVVPPPELEDLLQGRRSLLASPGPAYQGLLSALSGLE